ncbi:MAG: DUF1015 domain-containing protein [Elusimicrobiota bacterium]|nr:DUF1015 domain-containing protein [Elusimicrobiota bacterium]
MPDARPFRGWRYAPTREPLGSKLCPPYDVIGPALAKSLRAGKKNSVYLELPAGEAPAKYAAAKAAWAKWRADGTLRRDAATAYYLVEERFRHAGRAYTRRGVLAGLGVTPKASKLVIPHERTLSKPKADRLRMIAALQANVSPIFGVFEDKDRSAQSLLARLGRGRPAATASAKGVSYKLFVVDAPAAVQALSRLLAPRECLIADGHHRYSCAQEHYRRRPSKEAEAVLCYLVPDADPGLVVLPTHRVSGGGLLDRAGRLASLRPQKDLKGLVKALDAAKNPYAFGLIEGGAILLGEPRTKNGCRSGLCVEWLGKHLLAGIAPDALSYTPDPAEAARRVDAGGSAVLVKPFPVAQVRKAAKAVGLLPQKSTYFIPKIVTGLVFRDLNP